MIRKKLTYFSLNHLLYLLFLLNRFKIWSVAFAERWTVRQCSNIEPKQRH